MNKFVRVSLVILLLINGISACYGGLSMIIDPSGGSLGLSLHRLVFLPFRSYLVPGIILLLVNGISSLLIALLVARRIKSAGIYACLQGFILTGWILIQASLIPNSGLQVFFGAIGVLLIILGVVLSQRKVNFENGN